LDTLSYICMLLITDVCERVSPSIRNIMNLATMKREISQ